MYFPFLHSDQPAWGAGWSPGKSLSLWWRAFSDPRPPHGQLTTLRTAVLSESPHLWSTLAPKSNLNLIQPLRSVIG